MKKPESSLPILRRGNAIKSYPSSLVLRLYKKARIVATTCESFRMTYREGYILQSIYCKKVRL